MGHTTSSERITMRSVLGVVLLSAFPFGVPAAARAQAIAAGVWSGAVIDPSGKSKPVTYAVTRVGDSLSITLSETAGGARVAFSEVHQVEDTLRFSWSGGKGGAKLVCKLVRQADGPFEGTCRDASGQEGRMRMIPPPTRP
jgi:hypothetical protein